MKSSVPVAYFENRYHISINGQVINLANNTPLTPIMNTNGYYKVSLAKGNGTNKQEAIHRLVALHFLPNPYQYPHVNHKNGIKTDNRAENLEWCTSAINSHHALKTGLRPGYMSADDKEKYLHEILAGKQVKDLAKEINRLPESLHKMLRETAKRLGIECVWKNKMKENRRDAAIRNLEKINNQDSI